MIIKMGLLYIYKCINLAFNNRHLKTLISLLTACKCNKVTHDLLPDVVNGVGIFSDFYVQAIITMGLHASRFYTVHRRLH